MIVTPRDFSPRLAPLEHERPHTFAFRGSQVLLRESDLALPEAAALEGIVDPKRVLPVGTLGNSYFRTTWVPETTQPIDGFAFMGLRPLFGRLDDTMLAIAGRAFQIADWARTHQFCGVCGMPTARVEGERAMKCACGHVFYPRIAPAMMVLVKRGDAILLARSVLVPAGGRMSALAGFLEPGESVEEAVHREVREEVGLEVKDLRYFGSQSWPFPGSLMIAFTAEYAGGDIHCDANEIAEARWFGPGDPLPELSPHQSISRALIDANLPGQTRMSAKSLGSDPGVVLALQMTPSPALPHALHLAGARGGGRKPTMLHHLSFAVSNLQRAAKFYDAVLGALGYVRVWTEADAVGYGHEEGEDKFSIKTAAHVQVLSPRFHLAFAAGSRKAVDDFYRAALEHGGSDNGAPGLRPQYGPNYYAAFVRDPDGYRIEAVINTQDEK